MKKRSKLLLSAAIFSAAAFCSLSAYAGSELCAPNAIHCAYSSDSSSKIYGNYVKIIWPEINQSITECLTYGDADFISSDDAKNLHVPEGKNHWIIEECLDSSYSKCFILKNGVDTFNVTKNADGSYSASPSQVPYSLKDYSEVPAVICHTGPKHF